MSVSEESVARADAAASRVGTVQEVVVTVHAAVFASQAQQGGSTITLHGFRDAEHSADVYRAFAIKSALQCAGKWRTLGAKVTDPLLKAAATELAHKLQAVYMSGDADTDLARAFARMNIQPETEARVKAELARYIDICNQAGGMCKVIVQFANMTLMCSPVRVAVRH